MALQTDQAVNLLWTGGWDSTFRMLQLVLIDKREVQPYYIIHLERPSAIIEIRTMRDIKKKLFAAHPEARGYLLPTQFMEVNDVLPDPEITAAYQRINAISHIGTQYEWLARFCAMSGVSDMELCIKLSHEGPTTFIEPFLRQCGGNGRANYMLDERHQGNDVYTLFRYFRYPLFFLSKVDLEEAAIEAGFDELMYMTWFCYRPWFGTYPCGICRPCFVAIEREMGKRLPWPSRILYHLRFMIKVKHFFTKPRETSG
jgi:hypothetical protein